MINGELFCYSMNRVYVGRLSQRARERDIERFFRSYGHVCDIMLKNGYCFVVGSPSPGYVDCLNPLDARRRYTCFAQTSLRRQTPVYRRHGIFNATAKLRYTGGMVYQRHRPNSVYQLCFLMHTGTGMPES